MESRILAKGKASRTHLVTYLLLITIIFVIAVVVGYRSYQHLYYRQGLRHNDHGSHDGYDDEESVRRHQHQQPPDEYSSLLRSDLDLMQRDAGESLVSERGDRGSPAQIGTSNSTTSAIFPPGNLNNTSKTTTMAPPTPKIKIHQLDPSIAYTKRLITIGDVHGCIATLEALLEKLSFNPDKDHLIFTGDIINKGPDSVGVVEFARKYGASAVRGNHEDKILKLRSDLGLSNGCLASNGNVSPKENEEEEPATGDGGVGGEDEDEDDSSGSSSSSDSGKDQKKDKKLKKEQKKAEKKLKKEQKKDKKDKKEKKSKDKGKKDKKSKKKDKSKGKGKKGKEKSAREQHLAQLLSPDQVHWLESLPIILRVGQFPDMGETIVVHAGIVPGVPLEEQDPWDAMNMRSIDLDKGKNEVLDTPDGTMWANLFNKQQSSISAQGQGPTSLPMTIIYGHDARSSLRMEKYSKGLDTACIKGGKLTAFVFENGGKQSVVQVPCVDNIEGAD